MRRAIRAVIVVLLGCLALAAHASAYYVDGLYNGNANGFGGDVTVKITIQSGQITAVTAEGTNETKGIGSRALEQLPAKILAANGVQGVDTIAGATITSRAVLKAAEQCLELAKAGVGSSPTPTPSPTPSPAPTPTPTVYIPVNYVDGLYYGNASGFGGDVTVEISIQNGRLAVVKAEGPNEIIGSRALEQLPAKILAANGVQGVDTIAGATITSRAVLKAAEQCLELAKAGADSTPTPTPSPTPTPTPTPPPAISHSEYNDGTFSSQSDDFSGKVSVQLTIVNGWIVDAIAEGNSIVGAAALSDLPRQIMAMNGVDHVDTIAGATITSKAILEAATQCLALSENAANSAHEGVIRIPQNVQLISSEAFNNISAEIIIIPSSCKQLMSCSFSDIQTLRWIWIPSSVEKIADDAFAGCDLLCICTTQDSAAHKHAEKRGIKYRLFPE